MTIADVPVGRLDHLDLALTDSLTTTFLSDYLLSVVGHDLGEVGFVHVASMGQNGQESKGPGPVPRLSHPVEHLSDRLTVLFFSLEDATVNGLGELTHLSRGGHVVPTLGVDLGDVGVRSGFVHAVIIGAGDPAPWVQVDSASGVTPLQSWKREEGSVQ